MQADARPTHIEVWVLSAEQRAKIRAGNLGKKRSPETRAKISAALKGNTHGADSRQSFKSYSAASKRGWETRRRKAETAA